MGETGSSLRIVDDVTFAQLRAFACAARAGSFVRAAGQLGISQPAISEQIKTLEARIGRCLFERRRGMTPLLTAEGEEALEIIQTILAASKDLFGRDRQAPEPDRTALRISVGPFLRESYFSALLPRIYRAHPDVDIDLVPTTAFAETHRQIEEGDVDLAVFAMPGTPDVPPHSRLICDLPLAMVAPPGTRARLAAGQCALDDFQYIFLGRREIGGRWAGQLLRDLGISVRMQPLFVEFAEALSQMVEDGHGIGHIVAYAVADRIAEGRLEALDIPLQPMRRLISRSPFAPGVARAVEDMLYEALRV